MKKEEKRYIVARRNAKTGNIRYIGKITSKNKVQALRRYFYYSLYKYNQDISNIKDMDKYSEDYLSQKLSEDLFVTEVITVPETYIFSCCSKFNVKYLIPESMKEEFNKLNILHFINIYGDDNLGVQDTHTSYKPEQEKFDKIFKKYICNNIYDLRFTGSFEVIE